MVESTSTLEGAVAHCLLLYGEEGNADVIFLYLFEHIHIGSAYFILSLAFVFRLVIKKSHFINNIIMLISGMFDSLIVC